MIEKNKITLNNSLNFKKEISKEKNKFLTNRKKLKTKRTNSKILESKLKDIKFMKTS